MSESAAIIGSAMGTRFSPQELAAELGLVVWHSSMSPRLGAAWSPGNRHLLIANGLSPELQNYALVLGAAHLLRAQLVEPQDIYLYAPDFTPLYAGDVYKEVTALTEAYFAALAVRA